MAWRNAVNQGIGAVRIQNILSYIRQERLPFVAPIDVFYQHTKDINSVATPSTLGASSWLGALYAIAVVSSTENYLRQMFSCILKICPDSQKYASSNTISFGSVIWHPKDEVERGAFEHISLASAEAITTTARKFLGLDLNAKGLKSILEEFDVVCELRHSIVHSDRILAGKNGMKLKLPPSDDICRININYAELQEISAVCTTLVVSLNKILFEELSTRWATSWRRSPSWNPSAEDIYFKNIWFLFHSEVDKDNRTIPFESTWTKCLALIKKEFNL